MVASVSEHEKIDQHQLTKLSGCKVTDAPNGYVVFAQCLNAFRWPKKDFRDLTHLRLSHDHKIVQ